ncbi:hypothetical protein [Bradyrhizobium sp. UFLA03-84]|uniref:hypothetical protein n=1 Tax=Bradyrhizobium sp. UFLA03-84 TaxID=418599 RepID=UPI0018E9E842|nr:hypothetical protein [Bradyrhizobium sp. UFLA03-84]
MRLEFAAHEFAHPALENMEIGGKLEVHGVHQNSNNLRKMCDVVAEMSKVQNRQIDAIVQATGREEPGDQPSSPRHIFNLACCGANPSAARRMTYRRGGNGVLRNSPLSMPASVLASK